MWCQNKRPLREFDQIYMKTGDMVLQSEFVARWADGKRLAFIGDGDAISVCAAYPAPESFATARRASSSSISMSGSATPSRASPMEKEGIENLSAVVYNVPRRFPGPTDFDCFYTNPPWGASNGGASVQVFTQREWRPLIPGRGRRRYRGRSLNSSGQSECWPTFSVRLCVRVLRSEDDAASP